MRLTLVKLYLALNLDSGDLRDFGVRLFSAVPEGYGITGVVSQIMNKKKRIMPCDVSHWFCCLLFDYSSDSCYVWGFMFF